MQIQGRRDDVGYGGGDVRSIELIQEVAPLHCLKDLPEIDE